MYLLTLGDLEPLSERAVFFAPEAVPNQRQATATEALTPLSTVTSPRLKILEQATNQRPNSQMSMSRLSIPEADVPKSLWSQAYDSLDGDLVQKYEDLLWSELSTGTLSQ